MKKIKQAQNDFTFAQLPHNRAEVFLDVIKMRWGTLLVVGLLLLLFALPLFVIDGFGQIVTASLYSRFQNGEFSQEMMDAYYDSLQTLLSLLSIVGWSVFSVGVAGVARVLRQLAWGEPIFLRVDFVQGIKGNWLNFLLTFALCAVLNFVRVFFERWMTHLSFLSYLPLVLLFVVAVPIGFYVLSQTSVYTVKFGKACANGMALYGRTLFQTLLFVAVAVLATCIDFVSMALVKYILLAVVVVVFVPLYVLAWLLFSNSQFDKYINKDSYPEFYDKGVYRLDTPVK